CLRDDPGCAGHAEGSAPARRPGSPRCRRDLALITRHPNGGWIHHVKNLSAGRACPYCPMTPEEYKTAVRAEKTAEDERQARIIARGISLSRQEGQKDCPLCGLSGEAATMDEHLRGCFEMSMKGEQVRLNSLLKRSYEAVLCLEFPQEPSNKFFALAPDLKREIDSVQTITGARNVYGPLVCLECYRVSSRGGLIGGVIALEGQVVDFSLSEAGNACTHDRVQFWKGYFQGMDGKAKEVAWTG